LSLVRLIMAILVQLLPVSLAKLWELNDSLRQRSDAGHLRMCLSCGNASRLGCAKCRSRYCSTVRIPISRLCNSMKNILMSTRNVRVPIGPDISLNVKLRAFFIAIIEPTGASWTWIFAFSGASHGDTKAKIQGGVCKNRSEVFQSCQKSLFQPPQEME